MGRALPDVDVSVKERRWQCSRCRRLHRPGSICPPVLVWLVLTFCPDCRPNPAGPALYCKRHKIKEQPPSAMGEAIRYGGPPPDRPWSPGLAD